MASQGKIKIDPSLVTLRLPKLEDVDRVFEMFEGEEWMIGKTEISVWFQAFPEIFLIAEYEGKTVGCINVQNLTDDHAYIGNYFVDEPYRNQGIGKRLWSTQVARAGDRRLLLTSEDINFDMYRKRGFKIDQGVPVNRFSGAKLIKHPPTNGISVQEATKDRINAIIDYDTSVTSLKRADYVTKWLLSDQTSSFVAISNKKVVGYVVTCLYKDDIYRVGPLFADSMDAAKSLTSKIVDIVPENATFTYDADPNDTRLGKLISNTDVLSQDNTSSLPLYYVFTKTDIPLDKNKVLFMSQLALTRT